MPTPNLYARAGRTGALHAVPESHRTTHVDVIYATDRRSTTQGGDLTYGHGRSPSLAMGAARVTIGDDLKWDRLLHISTNGALSNPPIRVSMVEEWGRFPATPFPLAKTHNGIEDDPATVKRYAEAQQGMRDRVGRWLARTDRKDVFLYVHGYNNNFEDATLVIAQLWHYMGRRGVPIAYTWPAGIGGLLGYMHDRESGEFTVFHLKQFLRTLASVPGLREVHILAHSRGTDVITTALRELKIEYEAAGRDPREALKLGNLVLAAPDLDYEVVRQRLSAERVTMLPRRVTIYLSQNDLAVAVADWMFKSIQRIGTLRFEDFSEDARRSARLMPDLQIVDAQVSTDFIGHGYFHSNPAVSSDLILLLRDDKDPGAEHGRPLIRKEYNFWVIKDDYPRFDE